MTDIGELFINAINHWRDNKGIGTALIPSPLNDKLMVLGVLQRIYARSPTCKTVIITSNFEDRTNITEFITQQEQNKDNNEEFKQLIESKHIKIFTQNYVDKLNLNYNPLLVIVYHLEYISDTLMNFINGAKFKLIVLNKLLLNSDYMTSIYKIAPLLEDFKVNEILELRASLPVEECRIGIDIPKDSEFSKLLDYYNEYITTSLNIFGSFDIINQANLGNQQLNISSTNICYQIANENGWNEHLDMSVEFNQQIDLLYNPNALKDRASQTYSMIRNRAQLLTDYEGKLDEILKIVQDNPNKKILIINKRGIFASKVTDYLNNLSESIICMNYHDSVDNVPAIDNNGNPIYYKSGAKKGQRKMMGAKAQKTLAMSLFNANKINVLSTNNSPDKELDVDVDIVIITSPLCEDIKSYIYRLSYVKFRNQKIDLYTLYIKETAEQRAIERKTLSKNHTVKNSTNDENYIDYENNFGFVVDD